MIKKVISALLSILLCVSVIFSVPIYSSALETERLRTAIESVPPKSEWSNYIDTSELEEASRQASLCFSGSEEITQEMLDAAAQRLEEAVAALKKHTQSLSVNEEEISLEIGSEASVPLTLNPEDAADEVTWESSSTAVRIVSGDASGCTVRAASYSKTPVTVTAKSNEKTASFKVNVLNPFTDVSVTVTPVSQYRTMKAQASAKALGADGNESTDSVTWEWSSNNSAVAKIGATTGLIECVATGECEITAVGICGENRHEATVKFNVNDFTPIREITPVNTAIKDEMKLVEGTEIDYTVIVSENATIKELDWGSTDESVMTVSGAVLNDSLSSVTATVKALKPGKATLTIKAKDGSNVTRNVKVTVQPLVSSLKLSEQILVLNPKQTKKLTYTVAPSDAGNQLINWSSSDSSVCSVDVNGNLTAKANGVCNIFAETDDPSDIKVTVRVRVADPSAKILVSKKSLSLSTGQTASVNATVTTVSGATYSTKDEVNWKISDSSVATVSSDGKITAKKSGTALITVSAKDNPDIKSTCNVTVVTPVTGVTVSPTSVKLGVGEAKTVIPTVAPDYATNRAVTWTSSKTSVATVSSTGKIVAKAPGTATVTCKTADGGYTAKVAVTVITPVTSITLSASSVSVYTGSTKTLTATVQPSTATDKSVTYKSSKTSVATVSSAGVIKGVKAGSAVITVTSADGKCTAQCAVTVLQKVTGVSVSETKSCYVGQVASLGASVLPSDASNKKLTYTSSNTSVATVNENGFVTALKKGSTAITVKSADGGYTATCVLTVTPKISVTAFKFDVTSKALKTGEKYTLKSLFSPSDASEKGVVYKSSNSLVASVSSSGKVTAKGPGTCTVTGTSVDGGFTSTCKFTVTQPVTGVSFTISDYNLAAGKSMTLTPAIAPKNASNKQLKWKSDNSKIAKVSAAGKVTGVAPGRCNITCTTVDGGFTATCNFIIYRAVTEIKLGKAKAEMARGKQMMLTVFFTPEDATNKELTWTTSKKSVATVSDLGKVTARAPGTAVITCKSVDGGLTAKCTVTVYRPADSITLSYSSLRLDVGKTKTLSATILPDSATYKTVKWSSSDTSVATVDSKGKLTAVAAGKTRIVAASKDGLCSDYCSVTVVQPPKKVTVKAKTTSLDIGCATQLKATVSPSSAYSKAVVWTSSAPDIASVSSDGVVTAKKAGKVIITCTTVAGAKKAETEILCKIPAESIKLNKSAITLTLKKSTTLKAIFTPSDTTVQTVKWSSSNPSVVKVSKGKVTAVAIGSATITAKSTDGCFKATCFVTVPRRATGIKLNKSTLKVETGKKSKITATVLPADATYDNVKWKSSDKNVATVSSSGTVSGKSNGTAVITATSVDGGFKKTCTVTVITPPEKVSLSKTSATVNVGKAITLKAKVIPDNTTDKKIKWTSSDTAIATVSSSGQVITKKTGTVTITAVSSKKSVKASCTVKVIVPVTGVKLNKTAASVYAGSTVTLTPTVSPSNASIKSVKWSSSNTKVAKVSSNGTVTGVSRGSAVITCKTENGSKTASCTVTVKQAVKSVSLNITSKTADTGTSFTLKATVLPSDANVKTVTYSSSNTSVATVTSSGTVKLLKAGTAVITVKTDSKGKTASCKVTVIQPVEKIKLSSSFSTTQAVSFSLTAQVLPKDASDKTLTWSTGNEDIVRVDGNGSFTAVGTGETDITCTDSRNKISAVCHVTVGDPVASSITLNETSITLSVGEIFNLESTVYPLVCPQDVSFVSADDGIAYVTPETGVITAMAPGKTIIRVDSADTHASAACVVEVTE